MIKRSNVLGFVLAMAALALTGCAAPLPPDVLGVITTIQGRNATFNGARATVNQYIRKGDQVATGPATKVEVRLQGRGYLEIEPNTDPWFEEVKNFVGQGSCLLIKVAFGTIFVNAQKVCIEDGYIAGAAASQIWLSSQASSSHLVVVEGHFYLRKPITRTLEMYDSIRVAAGRAPVVQRLTVDEVRRETGRPVGGGGEGGTDTKPPVVSWCCQGRETFRSTAQECRKRNGSPFQTETEARQECTKVIVK